MRSIGHLTTLVYIVDRLPLFSNTAVGSVVHLDSLSQNFGVSAKKNCILFSHTWGANVGDV